MKHVSAVVSVDGLEIGTVEVSRAEWNPGGIHLYHYRHRVGEVEPVILRSGYLNHLDKDGSFALLGRVFEALVGAHREKEL